MDIYRTKWGNKTKQELQELLDSCSTYKEVAYKLGYDSNRGGYANTISTMIDYFELDTTVIDANRKRYISEVSHSRLIDYHNKRVSCDKERESILKYYFVNNSKTSRSAIRRAVLKYNLIPYKCALCGNEGLWNGNDLPLELDHINGVYNDHRLNNLRWLCPNCHATTDTYKYKGRGNKEKSSNKQDDYNSHIKKSLEYKYKPRIKHKKCEMCGDLISDNATFCRKCFLKNKTEHIPQRDELKNLIRTKTFLKIGKEYGVSDNAVRKWCKHYNLPFRSREIKFMSDEEWRDI